MDFTKIAGNYVARMLCDNYSTDFTKVAKIALTSGELHLDISVKMTLCQCKTIGSTIYLLG
jgi:hypothetical protein